MAVHGVKASGFGLGLLFAAFGVVALAGSWGAYGRDTRIEALGDRAAALVTDKSIARAADGDSDHYLDYTFMLPDGRAVTASRAVPPAVWDSIAVGATIDVRYDPERPNRSFPAGTGTTSVPLMIFVSALGAVFLAAGVALAIGALRGGRA